MIAKLVFGTAVLLIVSVIIPTSLLAHHSFAAEFDETKPVKFEGTVTKVEWTNPHIWFYFDVTDEKGAASKWQCEGGNPNSLVRLGWAKNTLKVGDHVAIDGWRARDGSPTCNVRSVTLNGKRLFAGTSNPNGGQ